MTLAARQTRPAITFMDGPGTFEPASHQLAQVIERLRSRSKTGMVLGLERMESVLARLGNPERSFRSVQVVGSNGKGSTSIFLATILGQRAPVGLYVSPHLVRLTERVQRVDAGGSTEIDEEALAEALSRVEEVDSELTFFEWVTAAAFVAFRDSRLELVVLEAGLGARLDATRVADSELAIVTDLSLEHTEILGPTIEAIAWEKAAAIRAHRPVVIAGGRGESVLRSHARSLDARVFGLGAEIRAERAANGILFQLPDRALDGIELGLEGDHQLRNAALAASAAVLLDPSISDEALRAGLARTRWPARLEAFGPGPTVLLDGAHNPHGAEILAREIPRFARSRPVTLLFGALADKRVDQMFASLVPRVSRVILTRLENPRSADPKELRLLLPVETPCMTLDGAAEALEAALMDDGEYLVVIAGSLYLAGELLPTLRARFGSVG
ncbi:MAG: bifunctional folylpolyglutamate synthase/dihydrofolate synthase [Deltaproteobacteria bacterium]|nr:bifunctional folylpolyglutamate synthase/dihydrofolate synthase [Deltaproteobacteria bacterium]